MLTLLVILKSINKTVIFLMYFTCQMEFDYRLHHPFAMSVAGASQSGKSTLIKELILQMDNIIYPKIQKLIYCYNEDEPNFAPEVLKKLSIQVSFQKGMEVDVPPGNDMPTLVVLDDFMEEASKSEEVCKIFSKYSHHRSMSVIITLQNFFYKNCRNLTLNSKYIVLFRNPRDSTIISFLGRQMNQGKSYPLLEQAYDDATKNKPNSYLFIDLSQKQNDNYRFRSNLFYSKAIVYTN